ncbi:MAG: T9SS type A sorting domain-containing protein [Bacteroidales bacterium]|nr:T9SS type A sorting domain-containing protein [Bacteroidales bacterium]
MRKLIMYLVILLSSVIGFGQSVRNENAPGIVFPDNVLESDCNNNTPIPFYGGQLKYSTPDNINVYATPLCGDLDDDGVIEIVVPLFTATDSDYRQWSNQIGVYSGNGLSLQSTISVPQQLYLTFCPLGLIRYPLDDGTMQGAIVALCDDGKLRSYSKNGQLLNTADIDPPCDGTPSFADFNNDGYPEVYVGNAIYDAATLKRLCAGPINGNKGLSYRGSPNNPYPHHANYAIPYAYNVIGDDKLELVCGNTIYNVNIVSRTDPSLNSVTVNKTITPPYGYPQDGQVAIADLDLDGEVEIVVTKDPTDDCTEDDAYMYAYRPSNGEILFNFTLFCRSVGFPAICNIDNEPHPEILFVDYQYNLPSEQMRCLRYVTGSGLSTVWEIHHNDPSGMTTMTFFDFNRDEIPEIVFRDSNNLNIFNGSNGSLLYSYPMRSGTASEHPIVADVNNDGHVEIIVTGLLTDYYGNNGHGSLCLFGNDNWPSSRSVWNQYAYNVTNINNDLTVPSISFNNATVFTAPDGTVRHPYNNFLYQATYITPTGELYNPSGYVEAEHFGEGCTKYSFHGVTYTESGDYEYMIENPWGCDTLLFVHVQIGDTIHTSQYKSVCQSYTWNGITYQESGVYEQHFTSSQGCDSIVTLYLHVDEQIFTNLVINACDSYTFDGTTYYETGVYEHVYPSANGCDSIVILNLTINSSSYVSPIHGENLIYYQTNGQYTYYIDPVEGCFGYEWSFDGTWKLTYSSNSPECTLDINSPGAGTLKVRVYTECGYIERSFYIRHDIQPNVTIYPNPTQSDFSIILSGMEGEAVIIIYNYIGQFIERLSVDTNVEDLVVPYSLIGKAAGVYIVRVINQSHAISKKVIKSTPATYLQYNWGW